MAVLGNRIGPAALSVVRVWCVTVLRPYSIDIPVGVLCYYPPPGGIDSSTTQIREYTPLVGYAAVGRIDVDSPVSIYNP